jgi:hypothetical protein
MEVEKNLETLDWEESENKRRFKQFLKIIK